MIESEYPEGAEPYAEFPAPAPKVDPEAFAREAYREYRAANRPFRRAFPGGERRRKILLAVGRHTAARKEAQS